MTPERWREVTELFHRTLSRAETDRESFLDDACGGDRELRDEVEALLAGHHKVGTQEVWSIGGLDEPDDALSPGAFLGRYRIERVLGRCGIGRVFLAYDTTLHRQVALKVLDGSAGEETPRQKPLREARSAAALSHPNICTILEVGEANGTAFIAMEYL